MTPNSLIHLFLPLFQILLLLSTLAKVSEGRRKPAQLTGSLTEQIMRATNNLDLRCFREGSLEGVASLLGYLLCRKTKTVTFETRLTGMIRNIYFSEIERTYFKDCRKPLCSILSNNTNKGKMRICENLKMPAITASEKLSYITASSRYKNTIYGVAEKIKGKNARIVVMNLGKDDEICEHVFNYYKTRKKTWKPTEISRYTCGMTQGTCPQSRRQCVFICVFIFMSTGKRRHKIAEFPETDYHKPQYQHTYEFHEVTPKVQIILSISVDKRQRMYLLVSNGHASHIEIIDTAAKYSSIGSFNSKSFIYSFDITNGKSITLVTKKRSIDFYSFPLKRNSNGRYIVSWIRREKTVAKQEDEIVCWHRDGKHVVIVNKSNMYERRVLSRYIAKDGPLRKKYITV